MPQTPEQVKIRVPRGRYRHYKGDTVEVLGVSQATHDGEVCVSYWHRKRLWHRPIQEFFEIVNTRGDVRFVRLPAKKKKLRIPPVLAELVTTLAYMNQLPERAAQFRDHPQARECALNL